MSFDSFGRPNCVAKRQRGDSPVPQAAVQSGASSSRGPDLGNPMLNPASVFLPLAGSTQEDLALFQNAAGLLNSASSRDWIDGHLARHAVSGDAGHNGGFHAAPV